MPPRRARPPRTSRPDSDDAEAKLFGRLLELEERVVALEARLHGDAEIAAGVDGSASRNARRTKPGARCPGCLLELPKGRRGPSCVW
ncbi:MAG TPA: hypothetical protein VEY30_07815, partial [Myxococcaceae bacterium]|nr:hypothetical protein [Myxococcaceae bacterium]